MSDVEGRISWLIIDRGCITPPCIREVDPGQVCWAEPTGLVVAVLAEIVDGQIQLWVNKANIVELPLTCDWMVLARGNPAAITWQPDSRKRDREQSESRMAPVSVVTNRFPGVRSMSTTYPDVYAMFDVA